MNENSSQRLSDAAESTMKKSTTLHVLDKSEPFMETTKQANRDGAGSRECTAQEKIII